MAKDILRNRISELRRKQKLSLKELASAVGLRVDHHALYEGDCHAVPLEIATDYAKVLGVSIGQLFPGSEPLIKKHENSGALHSIALTDSVLGAEMRAKGLDFSSQQFRITVEMRGGGQRSWNVSSEDVARILTWLGGSGDTICFDTLFTRVLLRKKHATKIVVEWDPAAQLAPASDEFVVEHAPVDPSLSIWIASAPLAQKISLDYDSKSEDKNAASGQIENFFWFTEASDDFENDDDINTCFLDSAGDYIWINRADIAAAETPLINVSAELFALYFSDDYEHEE